MRSPRFIKQHAGGPDIFCHASALDGRVQQGDEVTYEVDRMRYRDSFTNCVGNDTKHFSQETMS